MLGHIVQPEIAEIIRDRRFLELREILAVWNPNDIAELLGDLSTEDRAIIFRILPRDIAADVFEYLELDDQEELIKAMAQEEVAAVLNEMAADDRTSLLEELPAPVAKQLIGLLRPEERSVATTLLGYPPHSIGRLMTPDYIAIREDWTVQHVLDHVRKHGQDSESLLVLYVVDDRGRLLDDIRIRRFLLAPIETKVVELMDRKYVALTATDEQESAIAAFKDHDREALPVVDTKGFLIGIVTVDDVFDVEEEEVTEDIQKIGGMEALEEPYMNVGFFELLKKRAGWLIVLFLSEMLTATAMSYFEDEIATAVVLALFIPLIISSGGNSGSQAATLVIRALALGEVALRDWYRIMRREVLSGLALGGILGGLGFFRVEIWSLFSDAYGPHATLIGLTVGLTLLGIVMWGTVAGSMLPLLMKKIGFDPASSSTPFVATLVDVTGLVLYFSIALLILGNTLLSPHNFSEPDKAVRTHFQAVRDADTTMYKSTLSKPLLARWAAGEQRSVYERYLADSARFTILKTDTVSDNAARVSVLEIQRPKGTSLEWLDSLTPVPAKQQPRFSVFTVSVIYDGSSWRVNGQD